MQDPAGRMPLQPSSRPAVLRSFPGCGQRIRQPAFPVSPPALAGNAPAGWLADSNHHTSIPARRTPLPRRSVCLRHVLRTMLRGSCRADSLSRSGSIFLVVPSLLRSTKAGSTPTAPDSPPPPSATARNVPASAGWSPLQTNQGSS